MSEGADAAWISRLAREPLLHFLFLGALLFGVYSTLNDDSTPAYDEIVVDSDRLGMLVSRFERTWQRKPSDAELAAVVDAWVREEVMYREGLALGLDGNDPVIRRRVAQKMDFISEGVVPEPDDAALDAWLTERADEYEQPARFAVEQVFIDPDRHNEDLNDYVEALLVAVRESTEAEREPAGDPTMLPKRLGLTSEDQLLRTFGGEFAGRLGHLPVGEWSGPVSSAFGLHLVRVVQAEPARLPELDEVREVVRRDWLKAETETVQETLYRAMRDRYKVRLVYETGTGSQETQE